MNPELETTTEYRIDHVESIHTVVDSAIQVDYTIFKNFKQWSTEWEVFHYHDTIEDGLDDDGNGLNTEIYISDEIDGFRMLLTVEMRYKNEEPVEVKSFEEIEFE